MCIHTVTQVFFDLPLQATVPSYVVSDFTFSFFSLRLYLGANVCSTSGERVPALSHRAFSCNLSSCHRVVQLCCSSLMEVSFGRMRYSFGSGPASDPTRCGCSRGSWSSLGDAILQQWDTWIQALFFATFTTVWVVRSTWSGPAQCGDRVCFI